MQKVLKYQQIMQNLLKYERKLLSLWSELFDKSSKLYTMHKTAGTVECFSFPNKICQFMSK